jgi:ketosteroid isomerase-like protein
VDTKDVIASYYRYANAGDWSPWCDLFAEDTVIDEQLAGHIEGRATLRDMMAGFPGMYARFTNTPRYVVVQGDEATVISHISAIAPNGTGVEADVANYFRLRDGEIAYMTNVHDTMPFRPVLQA